MADYPFFLVDAFTETPLRGNACAVILDAAGLAEETLLAVAREMNQSETAFVFAAGPEGVRARYFTPAEEIPLAGHPTLATFRALVDAGRIPYPAGRLHVPLTLPAGIVDVALADDEGRLAIVMTQLTPRFLRTYAREEIAPAFGLRPEDLRDDAPAQTVSTGTPQLQVPVVSLEALRRARLDHDRYLALRARGDFSSPHLFCLGGATAAGATFARHFGVPPEAAEDPFTGSATGGMAAFLWRYGLLATPTFLAEQGHGLGRPGTATVEVLGPRAAISGVRVGGAAVTVARGTLTL